MINDERLEIKEKYLLYLEDVPKHKWACKAVKISEDTSKRWRDEDEDFADQCESRISAWVKKTLKKSRPEFQLERLMRDDFSEHSTVEHTGKLVILDNNEISKRAADSGVDESTKETSSRSQDTS